MNITKKENIKRLFRKARNRAKIFGTAEKPRLSIFRSNKHIFAQLINDEKGNTLTYASTKDLKSKAKKIEQAHTLGKLLAEKAIKLGIKQAVFNKGSYKYHGRVKAVADGVREKGLKI